MEIIDINDTLYPLKLKNIPNPPKKIFVKGNINLLNSNIISIIGSRNCSQNGINLTKKFSYELSSCGVTIASGLALRN